MAKTRGTTDSKKPKQAPAADAKGVKDAAAAHEKNGAGRAADPNGANSLAGRADQLGAILAKGLDLAEAGLSLGLTVMQRVGTATQESIFEMSQSQGGGPETAPDDREAPGSETPSAPPAAEAPGLCIANRVPVLPGGTVSVSFSINNDSIETEKKVRLRVEGFTGEHSGATLPADAFSLKPKSKTIAPMDFEKFVLKGDVAAESPEDLYHGWIVVASQDEFKIPVRLVVVSP